MGSVLEPNINAQRFSVVAHLGTPWYQIVGDSLTVSGVQQAEGL